MYCGKQVGVVIPAFNEEQAIGVVIEKLWAIKDISGNRIIDEIVVCDNASTDQTREIAKALGARVVYQQTPGYGIACLTAIEALTPTDIVLFVDGDDSCYPDQGLRLLDAIVQGADMAIGSRTLGEVSKGAITPVQKFGNHLASFLIRVLWQVQVTDLGPFRAIRWKALHRLHMQDEAFGWTVEMQVKAAQLNMHVVECAVDSKVRIGQSKISGTLKGVIGAGVGILSKIAFLRITQKRIVMRSQKEVQAQGLK